MAVAAHARHGCEQPTHEECKQHERAGAPHGAAACARAAVRVVQHPEGRIERATRTSKQRRGCQLSQKKKAVNFQRRNHSLGLGDAAEPLTVWAASGKKTNEQFAEPQMGARFVVLRRSPSSFSTTLSRQQAPDMRAERCGKRKSCARVTIHSFEPPPACRQGA